MDRRLACFIIIIIFPVSAILRRNVRTHSIAFSVSLHVFFEMADIRMLALASLVLDCRIIEVFELGFALLYSLKIPFYLKKVH